MSTRRNWGTYVLALAVGVAIFWLAYDQGTYGTVSRSAVGVLVWWAIFLIAAVSILPLLRPPRAALFVGSFLAAFAVWTLISVSWSDSAERAFAEFDRAALYMGIFALVVLAGTPGTLSRWCDGLAGGIAALGVVALAARLFPDVFPSGNVPTQLPSASERLSWPIEYWNGLGILIALAVPLLLRAAVEGRRDLTRLPPMAALPALGAAVYLTSSRGAIVAALVGVLVFIVLADKRWPVVGALAVASVGAVGAVLALLPQDELVNGPIDSEAAVAQGRTAAILILLACAATALVYALAGRTLRGRRPPARAGRSAVLVATVLVLAAGAASNPGARLDEFREPPPEGLTSGSDSVGTHLASGSGSGRWQYWTAAMDEFRTKPLYGRGAGSYEAWWTQHGSLAQPVKDAHSLYLEALGELGVVGLFLILVALGGGIVLGVRRAIAAGPNRTSAAAVAAAFLAYAVAAGLDWMWELTVVSVVGIACLALLTGPAANAPGATLTEPRRVSSGRRILVTVLAVAAAWLIASAQAIPLLADVKLEDSRAAIRRGDGEQALEDAGAARSIQPWAASPYLQLALVEEEMGHLAPAQSWIGEALERDRSDWRLWLTAARIQTEAGQIDSARRSLHRAATLNPRSPLFSDVPGN